MPRLRLILGDTVIADSATDGITRWIRAQKPELTVPADSIPIVGGRYARNRAKSWGLSLSFSVSVGRQFSSYAQADDFALGHIAELVGVGGLLLYEGLLGNLYGFENAVLENARIVNETGISSEIEYSFRCGRPVWQSGTLIVVNGAILKIGDFYPVIKT